MKSDLIKQPFCSEILGPPGAGKTTLIDLLGRSGNGVVPKTNYRNLTRIDLFLRSRLMVSHLWRGPVGRVLSRKERIAIMRLEASLGILQREGAKDAKTVVFAQGPLFDLALLARAAERHDSDPEFQRWWEVKLNLWRKVLDVVIWLDAPDEVLVQRIRTRGKHHKLKEVSEPEARATVASERRSYEELTAALTREEGPRILKFDTDRQTIEEMAAATLSALSVPTTTRVRSRL